MLVLDGCVWRATKKKEITMVDSGVGRARRPSSSSGVVSKPWSLGQCNTVFEYILPQLPASLVAQLVKNLPAMWEVSV